MISICIPVYNYDIRPLVKILHNQAIALGIVFEILVLDDASTNEKISQENIAGTQLNLTSYTILKKNIGRSAIRNLLAQKAQYDYLLFLDADVIPNRNNFLKTYIDCLNQRPQIVYGGITYQELLPRESQLLRWKYGKNREALSVYKRSQQPYLRFLTLNYLISKQLSCSLLFEENMPNERHEDTVYALQAKKLQIEITHMDNPVEHQGLESSRVFLKKSISAAQSLAFLVNKNLINSNETKLSKVATRIKKTGLANLFLTLFKPFIPYASSQLCGSNPSLYLFDLYRLYFYLIVAK